MKIISVKAREILDSRGNPTVEVDVKTEGGFGRGRAPSGASTGVHEAVELRDGGKRYLGKGVKKAVENVNTAVAQAITGLDAKEQRRIDEEMISLDGTENKSKLGGNAIVATSMAVMKAAADEDGKWVYEHIGGDRIPNPFFNIINGGKHAGNKLEIQEFMITPVYHKSFAEGLTICTEVYHTLKKNLVKEYGVDAGNVGDEGGFAPPLSKTEEALDAIVNAIEQAGYEKQIMVGLDCAASSYFDGKTYRMDGKKMGREKLLDYYGDLLTKYPIISIEDPFHEEDFQGFSLLKSRAGDDVRIVGDDLVVTNVKRIKEAIDKESINTLLLKVNQIGTVTEAMDAVELCRKNDIEIMVSHRSGETEDAFIADFAVGINAGQIKSGAPARGERTAKYNQLLRIEERL
ncbi:phosphopyruvate hydratase [Candidatus Micrarchaeota archaeon]|nr:phosphopyruvate hydratase [Candidatus Micrarchaeota archaeon]